MARKVAASDIEKYYAHIPHKKAKIGPILGGLLADCQKGWVSQNERVYVWDLSRPLVSHITLEKEQIRAVAFPRANPGIFWYTEALNPP